MGETACRTCVHWRQAWDAGLCTMLSLQQGRIDPQGNLQAATLQLTPDHGPGVELYTPPDFACWYWQAGGTP